MTNEEKLSKALQDFKTKYPNITNADLQTFIISWQEAVKNYFIPDVMESVSDELLLRAGRYEDAANANFDTDGVEHNLNIGRYDGLMQAVQEINKHLP